MNIQYQLGIVCGTIILIKIELLIIISIILLGFINPTFSMLFNVIATIMTLILLIGHVKTTMAILNEIANQTLPNIEKYPDPKNFKEMIACNFISIFKGIKLRTIKEIKFIKEVANFNFKYNK